MSWKKLIPDLLDLETTRICSPPIETDQFLEGLNLEKGKCLVVYDSSTRKEVIEDLNKKKEKYIHFSGGWRNPLSAEIKFFRNAPGNVPFNERRVKDYEPAYPIEFDYLGAWREMLKDKGKDVTEKEFREMKISDLLKMGAPKYWDLKVDNRITGRTTSIPFPGTEYEHGYIAVEKNPEFGNGEQTLQKTVSNTTGARGFGTIAQNLLLAYLKNLDEKIVEAYIADAEWRGEQYKKKTGKEAPFMHNLENYAECFVESMGPVKDEIIGILETYNDSNPSGIQVASIVYVIDQTPAAIYAFPGSVPHAFIQIENDVGNKVWVEAKID